MNDLVTILNRTTGESDAKPGHIAGQDTLLRLRELVRRVPTAKPVTEYAAKVVLATHADHELAVPLVKSYVRFGASPRGAQALLLCGKVLALASGRFHVAIDDLRRIAKPALRHRMILNFDGEASGVSTDKVLDEVLAKVAP